MGRPKSTGEIKSHQQHLLMAPSEVKAIDEWMFANRLKSRGEAIRRLCQIGMGVELHGAEVEATFGRLWEAVGAYEGHRPMRPDDFQDVLRRPTRSGDFDNLPKDEIWQEIVIMLAKVYQDVESILDSTAVLKINEVDQGSEILQNHAERTHKFQDARSRYLKRSKSA